MLKVSVQTILNTKIIWEKDDKIVIDGREDKEVEVDSIEELDEDEKEFILRYTKTINSYADKLNQELPQIIISSIEQDRLYRSTTDPNMN